MLSSSSPLSSSTSYLLLLIILLINDVINSESIDTISYMQDYHNAAFNPNLMTGCDIRFSVFINLDNDTYSSTENTIYIQSYPTTLYDDRGTSSGRQLILIAIFVPSSPSLIPLTFNMIDPGGNVVSTISHDIECYPPSVPNNVLSNTSISLSADRFKAIVSINYYPTMMFTTLDIAPDCSTSQFTCSIKPLYSMYRSWSVENTFYQVEFYPGAVKTTTFQLRVLDTKGTLVQTIGGNLPVTPQATPTWSSTIFPVTIPQSEGTWTQPILFYFTNINTSTLLGVDAADPYAKRLTLVPIAKNINSTSFDAIAFHQMTGSMQFLLSSYVYNQMPAQQTHTATGYIQTLPQVVDQSNYTLQFNSTGINIETYSFHITDSLGHLEDPISLPLSANIPDYPFGYISGKMIDFVIQWDKLTWLYNTSKTFIPLNLKVSMAPYIQSFKLENAVSFSYYDDLSWMWRMDIYGNAPGGFYSLEIPEFDIKLYPLDNFVMNYYPGHEPGDFELHTGLTLSRLETGSYHIIVCDYQSNCRTYQSTDFAANGQYMTDIFDISLIGFNSASISDLVFTQRKFDVSKGPQSATLYVYQNTRRQYFDGSCPPILELFPTNSDVHKLQMMTYQGYYDPSIQVFIVNFTIPQGMLPGRLDYKLYQCGTVIYSNIPRTLTSNIKNYTLDIISNGNTLGPLVSDLVFGKVNDTHINITFTIENQYGLSWLECNITSNLDPLPYTIRLDVEGGINKPINPGGNTYMAWLVLDPLSQAQTFRIESIITMDRAWNHLDSRLPDNYAHPLAMSFEKNSFAYTPSGAPVVYQPTPVTITGMSVTLPQHNQAVNRTTIITFSVNNTQSKLFNRHLPVVYFDDGFLIVQTGPCNLTVVGSSNNYRCVLTIPFNFGQMNRTFIMSIYGFMDIGYNFYGFTANDLKTKFGINSILTLPKEPFPTKSIFLNGCTPAVTRDGGYCKLQGYNIDIVTKIDCKSSHNETFRVYVDMLLSQYEVTVTLPQFTGDLLTCQSNSIPEYISNEFTIVPTGLPPFVPQPQPLVCGNDTSIPNAILCSGNGECIESSGCKCKPPYSGQYCNTTVIDGVDNVSNQTTPTTDIIKGADSLASISLYSLRELTLDGVLVREIFLTNWTYSNNTNNETLRITHNYETNIDNIDSAVVSVSMAWFQKQENITFASQLLFMNPYTAKFSLTARNYPFQNNLNTLQVLFESVVRGNTTVSNECGEGTDGSDQMPTNFDQYLSVDVNEKSLLSRFQPYGIVDQRVISIKNDIISFTVNPDNITAIVALNVPHFSSVISLDPDFSLLLNTKGHGNGEECESSDSNTSMSIRNIVIIVVASAVGASVIVGSSILIRKRVIKKRESKELSSKLRQMG